MFGGLNFDKMVDTGKAEEYMRSNEYVFHSIGYNDDDEYKYDNCKNKIIYGVYRRDFNVKASVWNPEKEELSTKLKTLAKYVEENKLLFAQIEYLQKKKPIDESLNIDLKLIVQNIIYVSSVMKKTWRKNVLAMHSGCPLAALGYVAQMLCDADEVVIEATTHNAVLCYVFVSLCHKAGLDNVHLVFLERTFGGAIDFSEIKALLSGCVGVVTERSDVDSAVDAFVGSATQNPWKIRRILVQECAVDRLKEVIDWKSKRSRSNDKLNEEKSIECSSAYRINDKLFIFEYTGLEQCDDYVIIEAYRTVKELLSLLNTYEPFAVSLWCSDVSQANEIAYGIDSLITWINDYGSFYGPPKSSQAYYGIIDIAYPKSLFTSLTVLKILTIAGDNWMKLSAIKRIELLKLALKRAKEIDHRIKSNFDIDLNVLDGNFVEVNNGGICVGLEIPEIATYVLSDELKVVFTSLLNGFTVIHSELLNDNLLSSLLEVGVPLVSKGLLENRYATVLPQYKTKVVRTNFGTIFAN